MLSDCFQSVEKFQIMSEFKFKWNIQAFFLLCGLLEEKKVKKKKRS